ncbi:MAG: argininosuccinate lyase [Cytophagales bacterium]|nr:argininosuccinate lyase [Cytophagales bacterium]MDW8384177.1 argininosuccinate lyase [Flammeovirgaceae bacterium]
MKLWQKHFETDKMIEKFTIGTDRETDIFLAPYDILASLAHAHMITSIGLLSQEELKAIRKELLLMYQQIKNGTFSIEPPLEDIHSKIEFVLTQKLGETGKKIHSGRSRNDQVLTALKLYIRAEIRQITHLVHQLFEVLLERAQSFQDVLMPGYTHLQVAMPSSFGLWFSAYAESLTDDLLVMQAAYRVANQNPLGSAAGYGTSFPLNRQMTTELLGFETMNYNVINAQFTRGKTEKILGFALNSIASTLSRLAMDICLYSGANYNFWKLPDELTTGSSIMPHKKNPDVFELIRGKCNQITAFSNEVSLIMNNLPSGYHREMQIIKQPLINAITQLKDCLEMTLYAIPRLEINRRAIESDCYRYMFSVELVHEFVKKGLSFRDAYQKVSQLIENQEYEEIKTIHHTHEGSIGNLCLEKIREKIDRIITDFQFHIAISAEEKLTLEN